MDCASKYSRSCPWASIYNLNIQIHIYSNLAHLGSKAERTSNSFITTTNSCSGIMNLELKIRDAPSEGTDLVLLWDDFPHRLSVRLQFILGCLLSN